MTTINKSARLLILGTVFAWAVLFALFLIP
jgi:hypothetical protein